MLLVAQIIFVIVCIMIIISILLQAGKGGGLSGVLGGGIDQTVFGGRGAASFLVKLTTGLGIAYFIIAILLTAFPTAKESKSIITKQLEQTAKPPSETSEGTEAPVAPGSFQEKQESQPSSFEGEQPLVPQEQGSQTSQPQQSGQ